MDAARPASSAAARPPDRPPPESARAAADEEAAQGLLSVSPDSADDDDLVKVERLPPPPPSPSTASSAGRASRGGLPPIRIPLPERRQSALARSRPAGAPRTPNRVRFDIDDEEAGVALDENGQPIWLDDEDYFEGGRDGEEEGEEGGEDEREPAAGEGQRIPLLTDIEAPSVTLALEFDPEDHLENAKPRSNLRNAFMNMANSIM
jgi:sodium-coupled neutral amino acid transporter 11